MADGFTSIYTISRNFIIKKSKKPTMVTQNHYYEEHTKALVSVDCIIFGFDNGSLKILLGRRKIDPGRGAWALYGGFVTPTENLDDAATRVLTELTGIHDIYMRQVGAYGAIHRDPVSRVISIAYCALINVKDYDENLRREYNLEWFNINELPELFSDHGTIVNDALTLMRSRIKTEPLCFSLLPKMFTLTPLQNVYQAVMGKELDKRNFRKRAKQSGTIVETGKIDKLTSKRGAMLYTLNTEIEDFRF